MGKSFKKYTIISAVVLIASLFAVGVFAMPFGIFGHPKNGPYGGQNNASIALNNALTARDFTAFQDAVTTYNIIRFENITQDQFNVLVSEYQNKTKMQDEMNQTRTDINNAIKSNDYNAWKQAMTNWFNSITGQDAFNRIVARYNNSTNSTMIGKHWGRMPRGPMSGLAYATHTQYHGRGR